MKTELDPNVNNFGSPIPKREEEEEEEEEEGPTISAAMENTIGVVHLFWQRCLTMEFQLLISQSGPKSPRQMKEHLKMINGCQRPINQVAYDKNPLKHRGRESISRAESKGGRDSVAKVISKFPKKPCRIQIPNPPKIPADSNLSLHKMKGRIQKRDQQMNRSIFQEGGLPDGSKVFYVSHRKNLLEGYKWGRGIFCYCCDTEIIPSQFEAHAGQASRKKPYGNIYISNGVSLQEYASSLKLACGPLSKKNDELCGICRKDGDLSLCDGCPRSFHKECVSETNTLQRKWFCKYCRNSMKRVVQNSGVDPIEQIAKRCTRIADNSDTCDLVVVACAICRAYDFKTEGFNDQIVILCDQCEREYHIGCLKEDKNIDLKELPPGNWFCTEDCEKLHSDLQKLVACGPVKVAEYVMGLTRKKSKDSDAARIGIGITDSDMKWILVRGKYVSDENKVLLSQAVDIFHKCFYPIVDSETGKDFIPSMAYGDKMDLVDFTGVHCAMLTIDSKVVTAGMFRVFGSDIAELSIVATSEPNQGKGYFQLFFNCFEILLTNLKIKKMVVPAAENVKSMWIEQFGFKKVTPDQLREYRQTLTSMVSFQGTTLLERDVVPQGQRNFGRWCWSQFFKGVSNEFYFRVGQHAF